MAPRPIAWVVHTTARRRQDGCVARLRAASCAAVDLTLRNEFSADTSLVASCVRRPNSQHALQCGAVLGAVQASSLRADRCAASGLDGASAQLEHRAVACWPEGV